MPLEPTLDLDEDLLLAIHRIGRLMGSRQVSSRIADAAGADVSQQGVQLLRALYRFKAQQIADLARLAHMDVAAVSRQLRLLEDAGLVKRAAVVGDGRVALISLTPAGTRVAKRIREVGLRHLGNALTDWSPQDRKQLTRLLSRLIDDLVATEIPPAGSRKHAGART